MQADIFCRVVDNFGDIGVCWRLARRLAHGRGWRVRLWVDNLQAFARIEPELGFPGLAHEVSAARPAGGGPIRIQQVEIVPWTRPAPDLEPAGVVIEAFACDPPPRYLDRMRNGRHVWINLEYLSAEPWVESCHGLPSPQAGGLVKHFFFPGFTRATGGLLREPGLVAMRRAWQADRAAALSWAAGTLRLPPAALEHWRDGARMAVLFCYEHAPAAELADCLARAACPTLLLVPEGVAPALPSGRRGNLLTTRIPFVAQPDFDRLLWSADLNLVRGEDSFVRAIWAARPLVWQIYPQDDDVHMGKLNAWLDRGPAPPEARALVRAWNARPAGPELVPALEKALSAPAWPAWRDQARRWADELAGQPDLADTLADFCQRLVQKGKI